MICTLRGVTLEFAELSDPGRDPNKQINEDSAGHGETALGFLAVVCDGMGGHLGGQAASSTAVATILAHISSLGPATPPHDALRDAIGRAARAVFDVGGDAPIEMRPGSTCVATVIHDGVADIAHVGDSRVYLLRSNAIRKLTRDHSMVQQMVDAGVITPEQAEGHPDANRITRALGMLPDVDVELSVPAVQLGPGDLLLLCSDGLSDLLTDQDTAAVVREWVGSGIAVVCQRLVEMANARGGYDNITVQAIRIIECRSAINRTVVEEPPPSAASSPMAVPDPRRSAGGVPKTAGANTAEPLSAHHPRPAPTLLEEPPPHQGPPLYGASPPHRFVGMDPPTRPSLFPSTRPDSRVLLLVALAIAVLVILGVTIWWVVGDHKSAVGRWTTEPRLPTEVSAMAPHAAHLARTSSQRPEPCRVTTLAALSFGSERTPRETSRPPIARSSASSLFN